MLRVRLKPVGWASSSASLATMPPVPSATGAVPAAAALTSSAALSRGKPGRPPIQVSMASSTGIRAPPAMAAMLRRAPVLSEQSVAAGGCGATTARLSATT